MPRGTKRFGIFSSSFFVNLILLSFLVCPPFYCDWLDYNVYLKIKGGLVGLVLSTDS